MRLRVKHFSNEPKKRIRCGLAMLSNVSRLGREDIRQHTEMRIAHQRVLLSRSGSRAEPREGVCDVVRIDVHSDKEIDTRYSLRSTALDCEPFAEPPE